MFVYDAVKKMRFTEMPSGLFLSFSQQNPQLHVLIWIAVYSVWQVRSISMSPAADTVYLLI